MLKNHPFVEDVFGSKVINDPDEVVLFSGSDLGTQVDEIFRACFLGVEAERGSVEDVDDLGESEGESIFERVNAFGHA